MNERKKFYFLFDDFSNFSFYNSALNMSQLANNFTKEISYFRVAHGLSIFFIILTNKQTQVNFQII